MQYRDKYLPLTPRKRVTPVEVWKLKSMAPTNILCSAERDTNRTCMSFSASLLRYVPWNIHTPPVESIFLYEHSRRHPSPPNFFWTLFSKLLSTLSWSYLLSTPHFLWNLKERNHGFSLNKQREIKQVLKIIYTLYATSVVYLCQLINSKPPTPDGR